MFDGINRILLTVGSLCALLWGLVTAMSFGLPQSWCQAADILTLRLVSDEVTRLANGFHYDVSNKDMPTIIFLGVFGLIFLLVLYAVLLIEKKPSGKSTLGLVIFFSVLFRLILLPGVLIHENDIYRYIWDGKAALLGINPYKYAPADLFMYEHEHEQDFYDPSSKVLIPGKVFTDADRANLEALLAARDDNPAFYDRIGHKQVPTIYPPAAQILFPVPLVAFGDHLAGIKGLFVFFDMANLALIILLLKHFRLNPCLCAVYGWSPLVIFETSNAGHYDSIPIFFMMFSILCFAKRRQWAATGFLGLATLSKFFAGILLPVLVRPWRWRYVIFLVEIIILFYAPYVYWDQTGVKGVFAGFMTYNKIWSYNASIFSVIRILFETISGNPGGSLLSAKFAAGGLYLAVWIYLILKKSEGDLQVVHKCFWLVALLFIINPVGDPWYFCWAVPFLCFFPYRSWYLLSGLLMLSYQNFRYDLWIVDQRLWGLPLIGLMTYLPFFCYLVLETVHRPVKIKALLTKDGIQA